MSETKRKVPKLRFPGFTEDWEQRKLGEVFDRYESRVETPHDGYWRLGLRSHCKGTFHTYVEPGSELETSDMNIVKEGNFILNITFAWELALAITDSDDDGKLVSHRFPQFKPKRNLLIKFFKHTLSNNKFKHHLQLASPGGAGRNKVLKINEMLKFELLFPNMEEQLAITKILEDFDNLITLHQRKLGNLKLKKKALLQKLFPKNGEQLPELRFPGFTDAWEQRKLGEVVERVSCTSEDSEIPQVEYEDIISGEGRLNKDITKKLSNKKGILFRKGDVLYGKLRPYLKNWLLPDFSGKAVGDFWVLRSEKVQSSFLYNLIQSNRFELASNQSTGTKMPRADWNLVANTEFPVPVSIEEQISIGNIFKLLNNSITLHQRKYSLNFHITR